ncbi:hypothetical protein HQ865_20275 [Mucilaginibacter mali]|uniref:Uncharacterized protein n=1 Tax=Mucilaginibacter mali TaxID=2740462 RepID=A0A7D4ULN1_9SPHI|nr:hypothetical protein [Mucilaginibacter mali]QKJ32002.1 hypothetical protein HQ865_20275 [Mucilaginibacter mali]
MIRMKTGKLLVVASSTSLVPIPAKKQVIHITGTERIFPLIHEQKPDGIILDYDHLGTDTEKVLRRLTGNPYYSKIKISCYKTKAHTRVDDLLKTLGVQHFIYAADTKPKAKNNAVKALSEMLEARLISTLAEAGY